MHRVVIDLVKLNYLNCGLGQFCLHLGRAIERATDPQIQTIFALYKDDSHLIGSDNTEFAYVSSWRKERYLSFLRPVLRRFPQRPIDLWHSTNQFSRYLPIDSKVPVLLTIHDLAFLTQKKRSRKIATYIRRLQKKVDRATMIATCSHYSAEEIRRHLDLRGKEIRVIYHGATIDNSQAAQRPARAPDAPFLFGIGMITERKNFHTLVGMLRHLPDYHLVLAGKETKSYGNLIRNEAERAKLASRVTLLGEVTDAQRLWLYQHCEALCFPSLHEGFGLPVVEAMAHGRPVFISNLTSLPEVAGELGFQFEDFDPLAMADVFQRGMETYRQDPDYADRLRAHARTFTWEHAAAAHLKLYRELCEN